MSAVATRHGHLRKDRASIASSTFSQSAFPIPSRDKELGSSTPTSALPGLAAKLEPNPAVFQVPKYTENDLQRILKVVLNARLSGAQRDSDKPQERTLKPQAKNVYKGKFYIDCYNFI